MSATWECPQCKTTHSVVESYNLGTINEMKCTSCNATSKMLNSGDSFSYTGSFRVDPPKISPPTRKRTGVQFIIG